MDFKEPSYLLGIIDNPNTNDEETLNVSISDLKQFREDCEYIGRFNGHPYYISIQEASQFLRIAKITLYKWLKEGKVHGKKIGGKWMIREIDIL